MIPVKSLVITRFGELFLKGGPVRRHHEEILIRNVEGTLRKAGLAFELTRERGRIYVVTDRAEEAACALSRVFGIVSTSPATELNPLDLEDFVREQAESLLRGASTFRVSVRRVGQHPFSSQEIAVKLGQIIGEKCKAKVNLVSPERAVYVEIRDERAFVYSAILKGLGGLPVGVSGRAVALLSGGIDSPVAAWLMMKRGCRVDLLHFHPFRSASEAGANKITKLADTLATYGGAFRLFQVPFYMFQARVSAVPESYELVLFRRFMLRVAERIAASRRARAVVVGDSLGQVASQTLGNICALEGVVALPVFRPLLGFDKVEIVDLARKIGTYDTSILPYKDCCSIIGRHPKTRARVERIKELEGRMDVAAMVNEAVEAAEVTKIGY